MPRPNVLLFFTDQQRADTVGASGNSVIRTPNLDRIAREGMLFQSAYTADPVCVPARCSLITGQYPHNTGCFENRDPMPEDRASFMWLLTEAGYRTHAVGKMHFTPDSQALRGLQSRDHQEEIRGKVEGDDYLEFLHTKGFGHVHDPMGQRGEMYYIPQPAQMPAELHATQWVGDRAIDFLKEAPAEEPFFLWASFIHPHPPFSPPTPWNKLYRAPNMPLAKRPHQCESLHTHINRFQNRYKYRDNGVDNNLLRCMKAYYYACVSFIDYQVGRVLAALEEQGQLDSTLVLYASDHGEFLGDYNCFGKRSMLDAAANVPLLARLPGRFAAGEVCQTPVSLVDVMPTILAATDIAPPADQRDGADLAEIARDGGDRTIHAQYDCDGRATHMILNRRWKYYYCVTDRREFLFDRQQDPEETRNLAGNPLRRTVAAEMRGELMEYYRREGYTEPLDGDRWREFPQPSLPEDPDAGLLIQDAGWARPYQAIPGYTEPE